MTAQDVMTTLLFGEKTDGWLTILDECNSVLYNEALERGDSYCEQVYYEECADALYVGSEAI